MNTNMDTNNANTPQLNTTRPAPSLSRRWQEGKIGYVVAWLLGVPLPILALYWLFFGR